MKGLLLLVVGLVCSGAVSAQMYRCVENGRTVFSDRPCAGEGAEIRVTPAAGMGAPAVDREQRAAGLDAQINDAARSRQIRQLDYRIRDLGFEMERDRRELDAELRRLEAEKARAANNLAGATWEASISQQMQAVTQRYEVKAKTDAARLQAYRDERARMMQGER